MKCQAVRDFSGNRESAQPHQRKIGRIRRDSAAPRLAPPVRTRRRGGFMEGSSWLIVRGIVSLLIGVLAFAWPGITIAVLVGMFAAYAIIDGVTNLVMGVSHTAGQGRSWAQIRHGVLGIVGGAVTLVLPGLQGLALIFLLGAWAVGTGVLEIAPA